MLATHALQPPTHHASCRRALSGSPRVSTRLGLRESTCGSSSINSAQCQPQQRPAGLASVLTSSCSPEAAASPSTHLARLLCCGSCSSSGICCGCCQQPPGRHAMPLMAAAAAAASPAAQPSGSTAVVLRGSSCHHTAPLCKGLAESARRDGGRSVCWWWCAGNGITSLTSCSGIWPAGEDARELTAAAVVWLALRPQLVVLVVAAATARPTPEHAHASESTLLSD